MVDVTGEVEMGLVQITRVMNDISINTDELRRSLIQLGKDYGMVWSDVESIATKVGHRLGITQKKLSGLPKLRY